MKKTFTAIAITTLISACGGGGSSGESTPSVTNDLPSPPSVAPSNPSPSAPTILEPRTGGIVSAFVVSSAALNVVWEDQEGFTEYEIHASTVKGASVGNYIKDAGKLGRTNYDVIYHAGYGIPMYISIVGKRLDGSTAVIESELEITPLDISANPDAYMAERYEAIEGGSVIRDKVTGLEWQRCTIGQTWGGTSCEGLRSEFTYAEAENTQANGWRLPTDLELSSLIYCSSGKPTYRNFDAVSMFRCESVNAWPTIDQAAFPKTERRKYWASMSTEGSTTRTPSVDFQSGAVKMMDTASNRYVVRLVRKP